MDQIDETLALMRQNAAQILALPPAKRREALALIEELNRRKSIRKLYTYYPDTGALRRELYPKHLEFFAAGAEYEERAFIAGNRVGKTFAGAYELSCHLTGWYPPWWRGRTFKRPVTAWVSGTDTKAVRDSLQLTLLGPPEGLGTGTIPGELLEGKPTPRHGVPDSYDTATIKHTSGGISRMTFKTYDQGRESFQAAKIDIMLFDEEPPQAIYSEGLTRTMSTTPGEPNGLVMCTFTPLLGLSAVVLSYMPGGQQVAA